ncbi:MAG: YihA family ribosome biogenesis GTP-binding protein [Proteobacteria bacterium]|nr:MAG: YihA family ribosome biogenesis GTP-binding protein [Pseudomonadota bacterium]
MQHYFQQANFTQSAASPSSLPAEIGLEAAFAGRSNSGKSSTINRLCSQKGLARTSKTPGRTQLINFFGLPDENHLVDLPGYGYAKVPENIKLQWQKFIETYLTTRKNLKGLILVMDIRHPMAEFDKKLLAWAEFQTWAVHILLNKADKLKRGPANATLFEVCKQLKNESFTASAQIFSAETGQGLDELYEVLSDWLALHPSKA